MESHSLQFAAAVRAISAAAREQGLAVPGFRSPPRIAGVHRTVRRGADGQVTVSVAVRDRPFPAVVADLVEGVVVTNELDATHAARTRSQLWAAVAATPAAVELAGAA